jgi:hypothetical protein
VAGAGRLCPAGVHGGRRTEEVGGVEVVDGSTDEEHALRVNPNPLLIRV